MSNTEAPNSLPPTYSPQFLTKVKQEINVFASAAALVEKMQDEGFLGQLYDSFNFILRRELSLSWQEFASIGTQSNDFNVAQLHSNSLYIFKENLKLVSAIVSELTSRPVVATRPPRDDRP